jgi:hypothetical protein
MALAEPRRQRIISTGGGGASGRGGGSGQGGSRGGGRSDDAEEARRLTDRLLEGIGTRGRTYSSEKLDIFIPDVELSVDHFHRQYRFHRQTGAPFPCLRTADGLIPMNWAKLLPGSSLDDVVQVLDRLFRREEERYETSSPVQALEMFRVRLQAFLTTRFSARQSDISDLPGLQIEVSTLSPGLRVHYSPAYFFDPTNVLNAPTTPVRGWIQPGRYIFGAAQSGRKAAFEYDAEYDIPPIDYLHLGI